MAITPVLLAWPRRSHRPAHLMASYSGIQASVEIAEVYRNRSSSSHTIEVGDKENTIVSLDSFPGSKRDGKPRGKRRTDDDKVMVSWSSCSSSRNVGS